ncbi:MAG: peptidoglycan editing factor PgeF [Nitrospiraceae bacterium]|nr:peptidoglycan editing factor PgeF [Nitrospiraceae bacterium]
MQQTHLIYPEIFDEPAFAFFTGKAPGADTGLIAHMLGIPEDDIFMPVQRHTGRVVVYERGMERPEADAVITDMDGVLLGVKVADCVPILLQDTVTGAIGAVHAGWRGTAQGILKNTVMKMNEACGSNPEDMLVAIGPAIRGCCYEVGRDVFEEVTKETGPGDYHETRDGRYFLDLPSANMHQALSLMVPFNNIWISGACTYDNPEKFNSFRRDKGSGRQGGFIGKSIMKNQEV